MSITIFSSERLSQEEEIRTLRKEQLRQLMYDLSALVINTGNKNKALALVDLINRLTNQELISREVLCFSDSNQEQCATRATVVAQSKVQNLIQDLKFHPEHCRSIDGESNSEINLLLSQLVLFAGSDVNAFIQETDGSWRQNHQLSRRYPEGLPEEKFWQLREQLRQEFCFPENKQVVLRWDIASHLVNGRDHHFFKFQPAFCSFRVLN